MIHILVNGDKKSLQAGTRLSDLLRQFGINPATVVVERNETVVARPELAGQVVEDGDKIEIVQFVGGGAEGGPEAPETGTAEAEKPAGKKARKKTPKKKKSSKKKDDDGSTEGKAKKLVIVESPAKAKTINKFLGVEYQVEASFGHVRDLPRSKMGVDLENNFEPHYIVIRKASKTVKHLRKQAKNKHQIFLAPDPDREGEAISWHLKHIFHEDNGEIPIERVVFNEITKDAVRKAFEKPRTIQMNLVNAQQARRILDRIVGYELSPLLWKKVGRGLSAGRVQSVALRMIVDREREIQKFVPEEYWSLEAKLASESKENEGKKFLAKLDKIGEEKADLRNTEKTEAAKKALENAVYKVQSVETRERSRKTQAPYTTSKLQQEAYTRLGYPAAKTMRLAQRLYEGVDLGDEGTVGLITYMRTDSVNIAASAQTEAADFIRGKYGSKFLPEKPPVYKSKKGAQEAHEAIRPTSVRRDPDMMKHHLSDDEFRLYDLIWRKFVASQMTSALDEQMTVIIQAAEKYFFKATGKRNLFPGFTAVFGDVKSFKPQKEKNGKDGSGDEEEDDIAAELPKLAEGEIVKLEELIGNQHFTKPPPRYNDASIVKTLEENGIGRPSTYAPTIYTLLSREYVNRNGGALQPTELGFIVLDLLVEHFPKVLDVEFTATMEDELDKVEEGDMEWHQVLRDFYGPFKENVDVAHEKMKNIKREVEPTNYVCDVCGRNMVIKWGRFGKFLACPGFPECKYTRSIPTGYICPEEGCGGDLVKRKSKRGRTFYGCSNYPKCTHVLNRLPKAEDQLTEDDKLTDDERTTLGT